MTCELYFLGWVNFRMNVDSDFFINLSGGTVFLPLRLIPFAFWESELIISVFDDKNFGLKFVENDCTARRFVLR